MACPRLSALLLLLLLLLAVPPARLAPPTCYSRVLALSREITGLFQGLQAAEPREPCVSYLPRLYLDIHNYCVLAKLRDFVGTPQCWHVGAVDALRDKTRQLYTIMTTFCRRDLVFLSDDCSALDSQPPPWPPAPRRPGLRPSRGQWGGPEDSACFPSPGPGLAAPLWGPPPCPPVLLGSPLVPLPACSQLPGSGSAVHHAVPLEDTAGSTAWPGPLCIAVSSPQ